jgi:uncharacterized protein with HEPN domain
MTQHDYRARLQHMFDHSREAVQMIEGMQREDLDRNRMLELSLTRLVEIVGEAAKQVSEPTRNAHPSVPWSAAARMRDRLTPLLRRRPRRAVGDHH